MCAGRVLRGDTQRRRRTLGWRSPAAKRESSRTMKPGFFGDLTPAAKRLWNFVYPSRWGLALAVTAFFLASATEPLVPALLKEVLDQGFIAQPRYPLWMVPVALIGLFATRGFLAF